MLFNSIDFLVFFPVVTALYFLLPHRWRWLLLLVASCIFYMAFIPIYILVLFSTIIIDYAAGIWIEDSQGERRKWFFQISILSTCLVLFVFKYFNFADANLAALAHRLHWNYPVHTLALILPIGLSFHTFQSLSYVIEVYRGQQKAERHFGIYALYVMFYPQLVAGPIERPGNLLHQFYERHQFDRARVADGLKLMTWGMFKKVVIADRLAVFVNSVYGHPSDYQGVSFVLATVFFAFQIYCDFSGYSDIAIGAAQVMGFRLMDNFNRPYFSKSIAEFWKRWHISLSTWFKDYLYIPLGGNRTGQLRHAANLFITFVVSGLWHGANRTYIAWGALNGGYLITGMMTAGWRKRFVRAVGLDKARGFHKYLRVSMTFALVCFAWIFFRAASLSEANYIITHLSDGVWTFVKHLATHWQSAGSDPALLKPVLMGQDPGELIVAIGSIVFLVFIHTIQRHGSIRHMLSTRPLWVRWAVYYVMIFGIAVFGSFNRPTQFIYFQF